MQERTVDISFPVKENILLSIKEPKDGFTNEVKYLSALYFYRKGRLSLGKAAELAGYNKIELIEKLQNEKEYHIHILSDSQKLYDSNILTVTRQVKYSLKNENTLDLVLGLNGI